MPENDSIEQAYADRSPYPEIKVASENRRYASLLMEDYAGAVSEFTAINQYLYHNYVIEPDNAELADMLTRISLAEMRHMDILARLILLLGGNPVYEDSGNRYWQAGLVFYGKDTCDRLNEDLRAEFKAIGAYKEHITMIDDPFVKAVLQRIILDEEVHVGLFQNAISEYCANRTLG